MPHGFQPAGDPSPPRRLSRIEDKAIMRQLHHHPLTDKAVAQGAADIRKAG